MPLIHTFLWSILYAFARLLSAKRDVVVVLMHHSISKDGSFHTATPEVFRAQMEELARAKKAAPLPWIVEHLEEKGGLKSAVAVTL